MKSGRSRQPKPPKASKPRKNAKKADPKIGKAARGRDAGASPECPVVGIGASAGGIEALRTFFSSMLADSGFAFVVVLHLDPDHESLLADLLGRHTSMPVVTAESGMKVAANHVYVLPPNRHLEIRSGALYLVDPKAQPGRRVPIDRFLRSLAEDCRERAVAVILSGSGTDGTLGIKAIKEQGGMAIAQDPEEASYDSMPRSAITAGVVDYVLTIRDMPKTLIEYARQPYVALDRAVAAPSKEHETSLARVLALLKARSSFDFQPYKKGTLQRRIARRMGINHITSPSKYLELLRENSDELNLLRKDLLIGVTSFFREPENYATLTTEVVPHLLSRRQTGDTIRLWVPGCATGEEAYSLGIVFIEALSASKKRCKLQIFASDVDEDALATARAGIYPDSIEADVSPERLRRFFRREDHSYCVTEELRELCVFALQNLLTDAPFSKLDMISCRNLLIYLEPEVQQRVIRLFHFALKPNGILFLGSSETINLSQQDLFEAASKKHRIYRRVGRPRHEEPIFPVTFRQPLGTSAGTTGVPKAKQALAFEEIVQNALIEHHSPAAILTNDQYQGVYFAGPVDRYFRITGGAPTQNILALAREGLRAGLREVIDEVLRRDRASELSSVRVTRNGNSQYVQLVGHPIHATDGRMALIAVIEQSHAEVPKARLDTKESPSRKTAVENLERELESTRRELESTIKELQTSNEELRAANEEAMSMNEEFQSTNEELETSKEELQSLNEELTTINNQLQEKVEELRVTNNDLGNLISSTDMATLFLDRDLNIKRFTPAAKRLFNVISADVGRPLGDITHHLRDPDLFDDALMVLQGLRPTQREVHAESGEWFNRRIIPYRTDDDRIDGIVITLAQITALKKAEIFARETEERLRLISDAAPILIGYIDRERRYQMVNATYETWFGVSRESIIGKHVLDVIGETAYAEVKPYLDRAFAGERSKFEGRLHLNDSEERDVIAEYVPEPDSTRDPEGIFAVTMDVTAFRYAQETLQASESRMRAILETAPEAIITISDGGIIRSFSTAAEAMFGYSAEEVIGRNVKLLMPPPYRDEHDDYIHRYLETGEKHIIGIGRQVKGRKKDGTDFPVELAVGEVEPDGERLFTGFLRDLTERERLEAELRQAQKMEAVGQLTGGLAHDFSNLLTVVLGNIEMLEDLAGGDKKRQKLLRETRRAAESASDLTRRLLGFTKKKELNVQAVNLSALLRAMEPMIRRTVEESIEISIQLDKAPTPAFVDASLLESALLNLVLNARDAMQDGGELRIETANMDLDEDYAASHVDVKPGHYAVLTVTDTGAGMSPEVQERAFEPFFTTKEPGLGTGLGLSMVQGFAKELGGHVSVYSWPGRGTTVRLFLPRAEASKAAKSRKPMKEGEPRGRGETILVVEDDSKVRAVATKHITELGYRVLEAQNGPHALELLESGLQPHLVFSDVVLPGGMLGSDLANEMRARFPELKILLTSGYAPLAKEEPEHPMIMLRKPYTRAELARNIRELLDS